MIWGAGILHLILDSNYNAKIKALNNQFGSRWFVSMILEGGLAFTQGPVCTGLESPSISLSP